MRNLSHSNLWAQDDKPDGALQGQHGTDVRPAKPTNEFNQNNPSLLAEPTSQLAIGRPLKSWALLAIALLVAWFTMAAPLVRYVAIENPPPVSHEQRGPSDGPQEWIQVASAAQPQQDSPQQDSPLGSPLASEGLNRAAEQGQSPLAPPADAAARQGDGQQSPLETPIETPTATQIISPTATLVPTNTPAPTDTPTLTPSFTDTPLPTSTAVQTATLVVAQPPTETPEEAFIPEDDAVSRSMAESGEAASSTATNLTNSTIPVAIQPAATVAAIDPLEAVFTTEAVILGLLCLIFLSINGLGVAALVVTLLYIRSRREQPYP